MVPAVKKRAPRAPKKITRSYLENAALYYLERYSSSAANLRRVLRRKVERSAAYHGEAPEDAETWIETLIQRYLESGLLNDSAYARAQAEKLRRRGRSARDIQAKLLGKGLAADHIQTALTEIDAETENAELDAARTFTRRRKLGLDGDRRKKDLAILARAGFSYDIARAVLDLDENV